MVEIAHIFDVSVEGSISELPWSSDGKINDSDLTGHSYTEPEMAYDFVKETDVDALAISIGNVHVLMDGYASMNIEQLKKIKSAVDVPFVIHGGSGVSDTVLKDLAKNGCCKNELRGFYESGLSGWNG